MNCSNCNAWNESDSIFCVNCGNQVTGDSAAPTIAFHDSSQPGGFTPGDSTQTRVVDRGQPAISGGFSPFGPNSGAQAVKKTSPIVFILAGLLVAVAVVGVGAFFLISSQTGVSAEVLPDHLGMFVQSKERNQNDEIPAQDFPKVIDAKNSLTKNENLPVVDAQPNLILYADGRDVPVDELKLIQLDLIKDDGSYKHLPIQKALIEGKPDMKRLRIQEPLASGKYAFALFKDYFNEGKHKFWAFQVKNSTKGDNGPVLIESSVAMKPASSTPKPAPVQTQVQSPGSGQSPAPPPMPVQQAAGVKIVIGNGVRVRTGPSANSAFHPSFRYNRGARVNVIAFSGYECPKSGKGCGPWAQLDSGYWIHSSLLQ